MTDKLKMAAFAAAVALSPVIATPANAVVVFFDVTDVFSFDPAGDPLNEVYNLDIGPGSEVIGIGWDATLFADTPSWLSEAVVRFGSTSTPFQVDLTIGLGDDFPGTATYSSGGIVDLVSLGFNFNVDADGLLRLEFYEAFDDFIDDWDAIWLEGEIAVEYLPGDIGVPAPASWALMMTGFGVAGLALRARRSRSAKA